TNGTSAAAAMPTARPVSLFVVTRTLPTRNRGRKGEHSRGVSTSFDSSRRGPTATETRRIALVDGAFDGAAPMGSWGAWCAARRRPEGSGELTALRPYQPSARRVY